MYGARRGEGIDRNWTTGPLATARELPVVGNWAVLETANAVHTAALEALRQAAQRASGVGEDAIGHAQLLQTLHVARLSRDHGARGLSFACLPALTASLAATAAAGDATLRLRTVLEHAELLHTLGFGDKAVNVAVQALAPGAVVTGPAEHLLQARLRCTIGGWLGSARARSPDFLLVEYFNTAIDLLRTVPSKLRRRRRTH